MKFINPIGSARSQSLSLILLLLGCISLPGCKAKLPAVPDSPSVDKPPEAPTPRLAAQLRGCRFEFPNANYSFGQAIQPNRILCDEGTIIRAEQLSSEALPSGLNFSTSQKALGGFASEKVSQARYQFYLENEAGYTIINLVLTIK